MLSYTECQIKDIIEDIIDDRVIIKPVGNHELNRHLVYYAISSRKKPFIFKLYYKKNRINREIASLKILSQSNVKCPKLMEYGILNNGIEWEMLEYIEGEVFERVENRITFENKLEIFEDMGKELGKIHSLKSFDFFGDWDENGKSIENIKEYSEFFIKRAEAAINEIVHQELPDQKILTKAVNKLRKNYNLLQDIKNSDLCHNDFDGRNILVSLNNNKWHLTGIIDFEQSLPDNKEIDLAGVYYTYFMKEKRLKDAFFKGYNLYSNLDMGFNYRINFYLLYLGLVICSWTYKKAPQYYKKGIELIEAFG